MPKKYLIISIVTLIIFAGWAGLYKFLGVEEEMWVIPPPIPDPVIQNTETNTGRSEVVSGEKKILNNITPIEVVCDTEEDMKRLTLQIKDLNTKIVSGIYSSWEINIDFWQYWSASSTWSNMIGFWPYTMILWPCQNQLGHLYSFYKTTHRDKDAILEFIKKYTYSNGEGYKLKEVRKINNLEVVIWEDIWWYPTYTQEFEVIGKDVNYRFSTYPFSQNTQDTDFNYIISVIKSLKIDDKIISFSPSQISEILSKIDENTKKQEEIRKSATGVLVQGEFRAEYISNEGKTNDKMIITTTDITKEISWLIYNSQYKKSYQECIKKYAKEICWTGSFLSFLSFSPSWNFILYSKWWYESLMTVLMNIETGRNILEIWNSPNFHWWSTDKKQFIYWSENGFFEWWLFITKKWNLLWWEVNEISKDSIFWWYIDEKYLYVISSEMTIEDTQYLKIFDLTTLKEVYSQEIK